MCVYVYLGHFAVHLKLTQYFLGVGAVLGLCWSSGFSLVAASKGCSLVTVLEALSVLVSLVAEHGLLGKQASAVAAHGLSSCCSRALEHRLLWCIGLVALQYVGFSRQGIESRSPALGGRFFTTESPGKPSLHLFLSFCHCWWQFWWHIFPNL